MRRRIIAFALAAATGCTGVGPFSLGGSISVTPATPSLFAIGQTVQLQIPPGSDPASATWRSNNTSVAQVNSAGMVTAIGDGTATITVQIGDQTGTVTVTVAATILNTVRITGLDQTDGDDTNNAASVSVTVSAN